MILSMPILSWVVAEWFPCSCLGMIRDMCWVLIAAYVHSLMPFSATNNHLRCDDSTPEGCLHCKPKVHDICCDLCHPAAFEKFKAPTLPKLAKQPSKSHIKCYTMTLKDHNLQDALFNWCNIKALLKFKPAVVENFGPGLFISDNIITCIVDCAQAGKILMVMQLTKETSWHDDWAKEFGPSLLLLIHEHYLPPAPTASTSTMEGTTLADAQLPAPQKRALQRCSACQELGHNSMLIVFYVLPIYLTIIS